MRLESFMNWSFDRPNLSVSSALKFLLKNLFLSLKGYLTPIGYIYREKDLLCFKLQALAKLSF